MNLFENVSTLDERQMRLFAEVVQELQQRSFLLRGGTLRVDPKYSFIEKHEELFSKYLEIGGWKLHFDRELGVVRLYHPEGSGRVHFNKEETILILVLRLLYHEHKQQASEQTDVVVTVGLIREKLHSLLPQSLVRPFLGQKIMGTRLRRLERFRLITFEGSPFSIEEDTALNLQPTLELMVSNQAVEETRKKLETLSKNNQTNLEGIATEQNIVATQEAPQ